MQTVLNIGTTILAVYLFVGFAYAMVKQPESLIEALSVGSRWPVVFKAWVTETFNSFTDGNPPAAA